MKKYAIYSLILFFVGACTTSSFIKKELNLREIPELMQKEEVISELQKPEQREEKQIEDEAYLKRKANLSPLDELFEDLPSRRLQLKRQERSEKSTIDIATLPEDVDLRPYTTDVKEQWNGTCSAFGLIATEEVAHCKFRGECGLDLSERHFWSYYKQYSAPTALKMSIKPVAPEKVWPQDEYDRPANVTAYAKYKVTDYEYLGGDTQKAKMKVLKALADGYPIYFWSQTPSCMLSCKKTCKASSNGFEDGGHAYAVVGYFNKADPVLIVKNSWGTDCGDSGFQYLNFKIFDNSPYWEASAIKAVGVVEGAKEPQKTVQKCELRWSYKHFWEKREYCWNEVI
jgi:C1A family cysteine protease